MLEKGQMARGHEFHYSKITTTQEKPTAYNIKKNNVAIIDGFSKGNLMASYVHLHFASNRKIAERLVEKCLEYRRGA